MKHHICLLATSLALCSHVSAQTMPPPSGPAPLPATGTGWEAPPSAGARPAVAASGFAVKGGSAPLETALTQIVPAAYTIKLDSSIPRSMNLTWSDTQDWMTALNQATRPANLRVIPQWDANTLVIMRNTPIEVTPAVGHVSGGRGTSADTISPAVRPEELPTKSTAAISSPPREAGLPAPPPKKGEITERTWLVDVKDVTLANTLMRWAATAGWRVRWDAAKNVMIEAPDSFSGSFEDAVTAQIASPGIAEGPYPLEVCFYPNTPPLARITRKGDQDKECK